MELMLLWSKLMDLVTGLLGLGFILFMFGLGCSSFRYALQNLRGAVRPPYPYPSGSADALGQLRSERDQALRKLASLQSTMDLLATPPSGGMDLRTVKVHFAKRYHPDHCPDGPDRPVRIAMFKEFWAVLNDLERGKSGT
ncbi:hypothetical protein KHC28_01460 [Ancylobacter sonchi]|uniref:hypothetical protein n=1 Tax=Ancylobacter sonchi TaxID=1937790 RepID=UPI001BD69C0E|nr:hypothetical protein [Ancylobacter sonchi]MBS7532320.1 hypothetical protein [Ancylobacter sonchi]